MNGLGEEGYKRDILHRISSSGIRDERFVESFISRHQVVLNLSSAHANGLAEYEEELEHWVGEAEEDYESMWLGGQNRVQEGDVRPKKRQRRRHANSVAGVWERQETLARYLARVASEDPRIVRYRNDVLSGRTLSEEEAAVFLSSPLAAARGTHSLLKMLRVDALDRVLRTDYKVEDKRDDSGPYKKLVWGRRSSSTIRPLPGTTKPIYPGDSVTLDDVRVMRSGRAVVFPHPGEDGRFVVAEQRSFVGRLVDLVEKCLVGYPISLKMGVWFVLTGEFVPHDPVRIRYVRSRRPELERTAITLEMEAWVPPEEVLEQYRHAQGELLGRTPRSLKRGALAVFDFVNQRDGMSWRELFEAWNKSHPRRRFKDRSHLYTTYSRAVENVAAVKLEASSRK